MNFSELLQGLGAPHGGHGGGGGHHGGGGRVFHGGGGGWHRGHYGWPGYVYVESPAQCPSGYVLHVIYNEATEMTYAEWRLAGSPGPYRFVCRPGGFGEADGFGQTNTEISSWGISSWGRPRFSHLGAVGDDVEAGDYHVVGAGVVLRKAPVGDSEILGTLQNGENIYLFGAVAVDDQHMISSTGAISPNDGSTPGIEYARAGSQLFGPGFVALRFVAPGKGAGVAKPGETVVVEKPVVVAPPTVAPAATSTSTAAKYAPVIAAGSLLALGVAGAYLYFRSHPTALKGF
jgi:hypothetical protein